MKKILTLSTFGVLAILGVNQSAMANCYCKQGMPQQGGQCVAPVGANQSFVVVGQAICSGQPAKSSYHHIPSRPLDYQESCQPAKEIHQICHSYDIKTGQLSWVSGKNEAGQTIYTEYYKNGQVFSKLVYDYNRFGHLSTEKIYDGNHQLNTIIKKITDKKSHTTEREYYQNGQLALIEHYHMSNKVYVQEYQNGKKHGKEIRYHHITNNVIYEAHWLNDQKHGEEKFYKDKIGYPPKLTKTVMWQNGKSLSH